MPTYQADLLYQKRCRAVAISLTIGLSVTIAVLTLIPLQVPSGVPGADKIHHVLAFAALTLPCAALYPKALFRVVTAAALFGGTIELIQPHVGRSGELADFLADMLGIGMGAALGLLCNAALRIRSSRSSAST